MNVKKIVLALCMAFGVSVANASTEGKTELSPYFGFSFPDNYGSVGADEGPLVGLRLGYFFTDEVSAEFSAQRAFDETKNAAPFSGEKLDLDAYRLNVLYNFFPGKSLRPFVTAGVGIERVDSPTMNSQFDVGVNGGLGVRFFAGENAGFRIEGRYIGVKVDDDTYVSDWENNAEVMAGLFFLFGKGEKKEQAQKVQDKDKDGVADDQDQCPGTKKGEDVDAQGCPFATEEKNANDHDSDGVLNEKDKCPDTVAGAEVDSKGCALDSDVDGVPNGIDQCPSTEKGIEVDAKGCPLASKARGVLEGVTFEFNSTELTQGAKKVLDEVAEELKKYPKVKVEVQGHTDNSGDANYNLSLSQSRAESVRSYLIEHGVNEEQLTAVGYGPQVPREDNSLPAGREKNRRVELEWID
ncbi:MAG: OmpA family protein [Bdellovibrionota bacterium]